MKSLKAIEPYNFMYVDAMNLLSRSYYGMPMIAYKGRKTGMLLGVSRLIVNWKKRNPGLEIVFIWEGEDSWRKRAFPIYKAKRLEKRAEQPKDVNQDFLDSLNLVKAVLPRIGVKQVSAYTFEADDTVWTVMRMNKGKRLFVSMDWDWWSLIDYGDILYEYQVLTESDLHSKFMRRYGCGPFPMDRMWVFKALTGDLSDNLSGIPRFPKKLAVKLAADKSINGNSLIQGMLSHGYDTWAKRATDNKWILDRNLKLIKAFPPHLGDLEWVMADPYDKDVFGEILLENGMIHLYNKLIGGSNGRNQ